MSKEYLVYRCRTCKRYLILVTEEVKEAKENGIYITCSYHSRHQVESVDEFDDLKDVLKFISSKNTYTRKNQKIVQKGCGVNV